MTEARVSVTGLVPRPLDQVWSILRDFAGHWHPFIARMEPQDGGRIRHFTAHGETTVYRERLAYLSDHDRVLEYVHLEGIAGAESYRARVVLATEGPSTRVTWTAQVRATGPRAQAIADGTAPVFEAGITALAAAPLPQAEPALPRPKPLTDLILQDRLGVTVTPDRPGDLLLFLHGIGGNRGNWAGQLGPMGGLVRAAALDFRGYGDSKLGPNQTRVDDYCDDILTLADALGAQNLILCGMSYGSWIATSFAMRHPGRLKGLILSGGCTGMSEASDAERSAFRTARQVPLDQGQTPADFAPGVVNIIAGPHADTATRETLRASMAAIPAATYRDALTCFTNPPERFDFAAIPCPVLMMTGEHDRLAPPAEIRGVAERIAAHPGASVRFEVIPGAGHLCNIEAPLPYTQALAQFIRGLP